jgi:iron complex outermembrane receptor protein
MTATMSSVARISSSPRHHAGIPVLLASVLEFAFASSNFAAAAERPTNQIADGESAPVPQDSDALNEVVVTARLRSENVMRVPDSVTTFSSDQIASLQLTQISDYLALTPNARVVREQDIATNEVYIRGVGSNKGQAPAVAFVLDGVILPDGDAFTMDLSDADQVEILKGPQGALYGKGALAGVINVKTRDPADTFKADAKFDIGSNSTYNEFAAVGGPLIVDSLLGSLSLKHNATAGYFNNELNNTGIMRDNNWRLATKLIANPMDNLRIQFAGSYFSQHAGNPPYNGVDVLGTGSAEITSAEAAQRISHNSPDDSQRKIYTAALTSSLDLGVGTLSSITAYDKIDFFFVQDTDFTALNVVTADQPRHSNGISQEIRFVSRADQSLRYILSGYYLHTAKSISVDAQLDFCFLGVIPCPTPPGVLSGVLSNLPLQSTDTKTNEFAASAQVSYDITRQLELTLALRRDQDNVAQRDFLHGVLQSTSFSDWEPKASLAYKPTDAETVYLTYSHGYKPGLFNSPQAAGSPFPERVQQEGTDNLELGSKSSFLDRKLLLTTALFGTHYRNAQEFHLDVQSGGNQAINVRKARIWGFETSLLARPVRGLDLNADFGYTKSSIRDFDGSRNYVGQSLPYQPLFSLDVGAQYSWEVGAETTLRARLDYTRHGKTSFQDFQNPDTNQILYQARDQTVDARLSATRGSWTVSVYGKNVFNERYVYSAYSRYISGLIFLPLHEDVLLMAPGATYGAEIRWSL